MLNSSAPLKKRSMTHNSNGEASAQSSYDEHAAAAALSQLNQTLPPLTTASKDKSDVDNSDTESVATVASNDSSVVPKTVHKPPVNSTMVDHTYIDYSVVKEELLSHLNATEDDTDSDIADEDKKVKEEALKKIKKIFGDISPTRKNSGGVVKPFPEKVCSFSSLFLLYI